MIRLKALEVIVLLVALKHLMSGFVLLWTPSAMRVSSLEIFNQLLIGLNLDGSRHLFMGGLLMASGLLALVALKLPDKEALWKVRLTLLQQLILIGQFVSISFVVFSGTYPSGYEPPGEWRFIWVDQSGAWMVSVIHFVWIVWVWNRADGN